MDPLLKPNRSPNITRWDSPLSTTVVKNTQLSFYNHPLEGPLTRPIFQAVPANGNLPPQIICETVLQPVSIPPRSSPIFISPVKQPFIVDFLNQEDRNHVESQTDKVTDMFKLAAWKNGIKIGIG